MATLADSPKVGLIMGSQSDWDTMKAAAEALEALGVAYEAKIVSAHRTPQRLYDYATSAKGRGVKVIIAGAGRSRAPAGHGRIDDDAAGLGAGQKQRPQGPR